MRKSKKTEKVSKQTMMWLLIILIISGAIIGWYFFTFKQSILSPQGSVEDDKNSLEFGKFGNDFKEILQKFEQQVSEAKKEAAEETPELTEDVPSQGLSKEQIKQIEQRITQEIQTNQD